jgi:hypothetical protein
VCVRRSRPVSYGAKHYVIRALHVPYCRKLQLAEKHIEIGPKAQSNRRTKGARSAHEVLVNYNCTISRSKPEKINFELSILIFKLKENLLHVYAYNNTADSDNRFSTG